MNFLTASEIGMRRGGENPADMSLPKFRADEKPIIPPRDSLLPHQELIQQHKPRRIFPEECIAGHQWPAAPDSRSHRSVGREEPFFYCVPVKPKGLSDFKNTPVISITDPAHI
ncbi:hypothetical protein LJT68_001811 [Escherichia coli]|nr:hypothetical protein [Escherichia coli]